MDEDTVFCNECGEYVPIEDGCVSCSSDDCPYEQVSPDVRLFDPVVEADND